MPNQSKVKAIQKRIDDIQKELAKAEQFLLDGSNSDWHGFRALYKPKIVEGKEAPPHNDWVKNVFIPSRVKALAKSEEQLERLESNH